MFHTCCCCDAFHVGMKIPKYNLCYSTRDFVKSLAKSTGDGLCSSMLDVHGLHRTKNSCDIG